MSGRLLLISGSPLIIPELSGCDPVAASLRDAVVQAARACFDAGDCDTIHIVYRPDDTMRTQLSGSFAAWGADVRVGRGNYVPELIARWVLREAGWDAAVVDKAVVSAQCPDPWELDASTLVVVVADGPAALTDDAPMAYSSQAVELNDVCSAIARADRVVVSPGEGLCGVETDPFGQFGPRLCAEVGLFTLGVWQDLAGFAADIVGGGAAEFTAAEVYADNTYGVGYHVAQWYWL